MITPRLAGYFAASTLSYSPAEPFARFFSAIRSRRYCHASFHYYFRHADAIADIAISDAIIPLVLLLQIKQFFFFAAASAIAMPFARCSCC